jgi:DNA-directed RNA polymerase specialized sigma24 family protein
MSGAHERVKPAIAAAALVAGRPVEDLFRELAPRLWHTVLAYAGGRRDIADDAVSEAFARAIEHGADVRNPAHWLYRVALNIASTCFEGVGTSRAGSVGIVMRSSSTDAPRIRDRGRSMEPRAFG